jgi:hypothetical protein
LGAFNGNNHGWHNDGKICGGVIIDQRPVKADYFVGLLIGIEYNGFRDALLVKTDGSNETVSLLLSLEEKKFMNNLNFI